MNKRYMYLYLSILFLFGGACIVMALLRDAGVLP